MESERGILVIRIADDCVVCRQRVASGQIDFIQKEVSKYYDVELQEVEKRLVGNVKGPLIFDYAKFTPYFMFMLESTYDRIYAENPPIEDVIHDIRFYNWMISPDLEFVKTNTYEMFFEEMLKFCHDSYRSLTGVENPKLLAEQSQKVEDGFVLRKLRVRYMNFTA